MLASILTVVAVLTDVTYGAKWAVLVAGSEGWSNYRHQADICHAYQLIRRGIPEDHIITMMVDDIAHNSLNPFPGVILNYPGGPNVYEGVKIDYRGIDVTPQNFLNVLLGNKAQMVGIGTGRVLESESSDTVFINFVDHGNRGLIVFPSGVLTAQELDDVLNEMRSKRRFFKMVIYIETCFSGSMFHDILPDSGSIYATTAANRMQSSYACCYDEKVNAYLGDVYSVQWMNNTENLNQLTLVALEPGGNKEGNEIFIQEDVATETLLQQLMVVREKTTSSNVMVYGQLNIGKLPVGEFQGYPKTRTSSPKSTFQGCADQVASDMVPVEVLKRKMESTTGKDRENFEKQLKELLEKRDFADSIIRGIALPFELPKVDDAKPEEATASEIKKQKRRQIECHSRLVHAFNDICFNIGENPYTAKVATTFSELCQHDVDETHVIEHMRTMCQYGKHRKVVGIQ